MSKENKSTVLNGVLLIITIAFVLMLSTVLAMIILNALSPESIPYK